MVSDIVSIYWQTVQIQIRGVPFKSNLIQVTQFGYFATPSEYKPHVKITSLVNVKNSADQGLKGFCGKNKFW